MTNIFVDEDVEHHRCEKSKIKWHFQWVLNGTKKKTSLKLELVNDIVSYGQENNYSIRAISITNAIFIY